MQDLTLVPQDLTLVPHDRSISATIALVVVALPSWWWIAAIGLGLLGLAAGFVLATFVSGARQPDRDESDGQRWSVHDEGQRLDQICGVVLEVSIALTAGAVVLAYTTDAPKAEAAIVAVIAAIPGWVSGALLTLNPLAKRSAHEQRKLLVWKRAITQAALFVLLVGAPLVGLFAVGVVRDAAGKAIAVTAVLFAAALVGGGLGWWRKRRQEPATQEPAKQEPAKPRART